MACEGGADVTDAISHATCQVARDLDVAAILTPTTSGSTARMVARYRPRAPIVAVSPRSETVRRLSLSRGVYPFGIGRVGDTDEMVHRSVGIALRERFVAKGETVVVTAGVPLNVPGTTNLLTVEEV
jgi:pyruvate kinase